MLIERTINVDGRHVTITHKVDTGNNSTKVEVDKEQFALIDEAPNTFTAPRGAPATPPADAAAKKVIGGGEGVPADTGGGAPGGLTIVFGPVILNCPATRNETSTGGGEGVPADTGGGEGVPADTGGGEGVPADTGARRARR